jgi:nucleoside-diphosphate kinase
MSMATQRTLVLLKPDAVKRGLVGEILARFERKGFVIERMRLTTLTHVQGCDHYIEHAEKDFFGGLVDFITSGPLVQLIITGEEAIPTVRAMIGKTNPLEAAAGTIRGDYATITRQNLVHASDSPESADREIAIHFPR